MKPPFKIAVVATAYYAVSHADVMVSRWLKPLESDPEWGWPWLERPRETVIASMYLRPSTHHDPEDRHREVGREIVRSHGVPIFDSITEALTLGGDTLAVDAVLFVGEHGDFPYNERLQKLYPRYEYWREMVDVIERAGRPIPILIDKHLSYDPEKARTMVRVSQELGIPLMAGSSLPHCKLQPSIEVDSSTKIVEVVTLFSGHPEVYGFHMLDVTEAVIEKRSGGEAGLRRVRALTSEAVWQAADSGLCSPELLEAALAAAVDIKAGDPRKNCAAVPEKDGLTMPLAYSVEHLDGLKATHFLLEGHTTDWVVALRDSTGRIQAGRVDAGDASNFYAHFAVFNRNIEEFFLTGKITAPIERTLFSTVAIADIMEALQKPGTWLDVSDHAVSYQVEHPYQTIWPQRKAAVPEPAA